MKRVAAGAHLPTSRLFEPAKRPDGKTTTAWIAVSSLVQAPVTRFYS